MGSIIGGSPNVTVNGLPVAREGDQVDGGGGGTPGQAATITIGTVSTGAPGSNASVINVGDTSNAVFDFVIPQGLAGNTGPQGIPGVPGPAGANGANGTDGTAATITIGTVTTGTPGSNASVINVGNTSNAVFNFTIPAGANGANGANGATGATPTIAVGNVTYGPSLTITNSGNSTAAVFDFTFQNTSWGSIIGTLSSQTDLQNALNAKLNLSGGTLTGNLTFSNTSVLINVPNGAYLAMWTAGAWINSGPGGGTVQIGSTASNPNLLALQYSNTSVWVCDYQGNVTQNGKLSISGTIANILSLSSNATADTYANFINTSTGGGNFAVGTAGSTPPTGLSAGDFFVWDNTAGGWRWRIDSSGNVKQGGTLNVNIGSVGSQQILTAFGWNNGISRIKQVIETDASYSVWGYDTAGGSPFKWMNLTASTMTLNGLSFGSVVASSATDLSHHINLWGANQYGFSVTSSTLNLVAGTQVHAFVGANYTSPGNVSATGGVHSQSASHSLGTVIWNGQGAYIGWNRGYGSMNGETDYLNHKGAGNGGHVFWNTDGTTYTALATIDGTYGSITSLNGTVSGVRLYSSWDSGVNGSVSCNNWFRSSGQTGWFSNDYGGGIYMIDATYLRSYNNKAMVASDFVISSDERLKSNIRPLEYRGRLQPIVYVMKSSGSTEIGFGAGAVQKNYPEIVDVDPVDGTLKLKYTRTAAILAAQLNALEDRFNEQEKLINKIIERINYV